MESRSVQLVASHYTEYAVPPPSLPGVLNKITQIMQSNLTLSQVKDA